MSTDLRIVDLPDVQATLKKLREQLDLYKGLHRVIHLPDDDDSARVHRAATAGIPHRIADCMDDGHVRQVLDVHVKAVRQAIEATRATLAAGWNIKFDLEDFYDHPQQWNGL